MNARRLAISSDRTMLQVFFAQLSLQAFLGEKVPARTLIPTAGVRIELVLEKRLALGVAEAL